MSNFNIILKAIIDSLPAEIANYGDPLDLKDLYIPQAHKKSLHLYSNLVVGARGVGKSTWTTALANQDTRDIIGVDVSDLKNASVHIGFGLQTNSTSNLEKSIIKQLLASKFNSYDIWRTVVIRWLSVELQNPIPMKNWPESVMWAKNNPETCLKIMEDANNKFKSLSKHGVILFDSLDLTSDTWEEMDSITRELLRIVLDMKPYSNIHAKVFLREDQLSRTNTNFPDSSKLLATKTELDWKELDLHGLLWQHLINAPGEGRNELHQYYINVTGKKPRQLNNYWVVDENVKLDGQIQRSLFEKLAGPWMGRDPRRGVPYVWSVSHLADGNKRTSPRSFLVAIRQAAENSLSKVENHIYPLHYDSIKKGVQSASQIRVNEVAEDYPWIYNLCQPLSGKNVPINFFEVENIWIKEYPKGPESIISKKLPPHDLERGWIGVKKELARLGIFVEMRDDRINMPDLFRVGFGLGRKGGVPPGDQSI